MIIRWIGQSGYVLETAEVRLVLDPYLSDAVYTAAGTPRLVPSPIDPKALTADAVICTHHHLDHLDTGAIPDMRRDLFFITTCAGAQILRGLGRSHVKILRPGRSVRVGDAVITAVYAKHTVEAFGVVIRAQGKTLYFSGDTLFDKRLFAVSRYRPDVAFFCINGKLGNMNAREAVAAARHIGAGINIPNHYGMFASNTEDPRTFCDHVPGGRILAFNEPWTVTDETP